MRTALFYSLSWFEARPSSPMPARWARRNRVEAEGFGLSFGALARLAQDEEPEASAVKREAEEDWSKERGR
jgi:hypothetical protein